MRIQLPIALCAALAAGACDDSQPTQPQRPIVVRSPAQDQLHQLSDMNLKVALRRAIYDSGWSCQTVREAGYVQEYRNLSMWTASCADGRSWGIFVGPDASVQVRRCDTMAELKLPPCEIRQRAKPADAEAEPSAS